MKGLSNKEIGVVSFLELNDRNFFTKDDVKKFFKNNNELKVYINRLKAKKRIIKINKSKYYLVPVKAYQDKWSKNLVGFVEQKAKSHAFKIASKEKVSQWMKSSP